MKGLFTALALILVLNAAAQYKVTLQTPNYKSGLAYLTYYFGKNINIEDSAEVNSKGIAVFSGTKILPPGIYSIVFPGKQRIVDFFIDKEQVISIKADTTDLVNKTLVSGVVENALFQRYQKFIAVKGRQIQDELQAFNKSATKADSAAHEKKYNDLNKELNVYRENVIKTSPNSMLATLFKSMKEPQVPIAIPKTQVDSLANYNYYKKHYWDGVSFMDDHVIRTPFFLPRFEKFFREIISQAPDSIIKEADYLILLARTNKPMYQFLLNWLTDEYIYPKYMGQDAVFVHLFEKYHSKGATDWLNEKQHTAISNRAYMVMANLIGSKAADLEMMSIDQKPSNLYSVNADYTLVVFWDPTCGHCKEEVPRIDSIYKAKWSKQGLKVFGVLTENEMEQWKTFIKAHDLKDWVHVYQSEELKKTELSSQKPAFRQLYDITQTPILYLLDKEKNIIAKKLSWQQMDEVLQARIKNAASKK